MFESALLGFFADFYQQIFKLQEGGFENTCFSPLSIYTALSMTLLGCDGATKEEVVKCLKLEDHIKDANIHERIGEAIQNNLKSDEGTEVLFKNKMFLHQDTKLISNFESSLIKLYHSELEKTDFLHEAEKSRQTINLWFKNATKDKITELFPKGSINSDTRLILGNALYFKGLWLLPFNPQATQPRPFHVLGGGKTDVQMMHRSGMVPYLDTLPLDGKAVKLKFKDERWELLIMLPPSNDQFKEFVTTVTTKDQLQKILNEEFIEQNVAVTMPKFKLSMSSGLDVKGLLQKMGVNTLFRNANLSKITTDPLFVAGVLHQAVLEVNEEGAEAAAATGVHLQTRCMIRPEQFLVDHAFVVAVIANGKVPVFVGHVILPKY